MLDKRRKNHEARKAAAAAAAAAAASSKTTEGNITSSATSPSVETTGIHFKHIWFVDSLFQALCS